MLWLLCAVVLILVFGLSCDGVACCFSCFLGRLGTVVLLSCMSYGLIYIVLLVDGCVASVVFIRCIPDLGVGVSSSIVLFSVVLFLIMLLGVVLFFCCFYLLRMSSLISLMFFFFFSFWFLVGSVFYLFVFLIFGFSLFLSLLFMLTYRRGLDGFHGFSDNGQVLFLFSYLLGILFGSAFLLELPARAARGIVFPVFPV